MYVLFLAYRYLRSLWLTYLAVGMVFVGVLAMVVVLSVMWGLEDFSRRTLRGSLSDVVVVRPHGLRMDDYEALCRRIRQVPGVKAAWPVVEGAGLVRQGSYSKGVLVHGLDFADPEASQDLKRYVAAQRKGPSSWPPAPGDAAAVFLGDKLEIADEGDEVDLFTAAESLSYAPTPTAPSVSRIPARVAGRFLSRSYEDDAMGVYLPLAQAQRLFRLNHPPCANRLHVRLAEGLDDTLAASSIQEALGPSYRVWGWTRFAEQQVEMLEVENQIIAIILAFMIVLAGFGILAVLNMQVTHKIGEIGVLKALGGRPAGIASVFLVSSTTIGLLGTSLALAVGLPFLRHINGIDAWLQHAFGWSGFYMARAYGTDGIPVLIRPGAIAAIAIGAVLASALAGLWPAWRASRLQPAEALRNG